MSEDSTCPDCTSLENASSRNVTLQREVDRLGDIYDLKCDQLREALKTNARLRMLLIEKGVEHEW